MKIGILSTYYQSVNYGGVLQSYALCRYIEKLGASPEQICVENGPTVKACQKNSTVLNQLKNKLRNVYYLFVEMKESILIIGLKKRRETAFVEFRQKIPHSREVFTQETINQLDDMYDLLIVGSDRVWNFKKLESPYFLKGTKKPHISYAASLFSNAIPESSYEKIKEVLKNFSYISVRESVSQGILAKACQRNVEWVLDPVFLLDRTEWENFLSGSYTSQQKYIFVYLLGTEKAHRRIIEEFAKIKNLKIISIPYANNRFTTADVFFGDKEYAACNPNEFVSLISNAEYIFTDSFHATAFSIIMEKQFFCFLRKDKREMGARIQSILGVISAEDHFCDNSTKNNIEYVLSIPQIDYQKINENIEKMVLYSRDYIKRALNITLQE